MLSYKKQSVLFWYFNLATLFRPFAKLAEMKVFGGISDEEIIRYLGKEDISKAGRETGESMAERGVAEKTFEGIRDSELLHYLARDPKRADVVIPNANLNNIH